MSLQRLASGLLALLAAAGGAATQAPAGTLVVLNKEAATLVLVDPAGGAILGRVATGEGPHEVALSADGRTAFVTNYGAQTPGRSISVVDLVAHTELRRVDLTPLLRPHGIAVAGGKVYITAETNRAIARYDPESNALDWIMGTGQAGTHMVWVNPQTTFIATANIGSDSLTLMERGANPLAWTQAHVTVGKGPEGFDVSADGRTIWAAHSRDGSISVVDVASKSVVHTIDAGTKRSNRLKLTPDGRLALISDLEGGDLVVVDVATRRITRRLPLGKMPEGILITPDGARAYVAVNGDDYIAAIDLQTLTVVQKISTGDGPDGMAWAPGLAP